MATSSDIDKIIKKVSTYYQKNEAPSISHRLIYDSATDSLEPIYFWILDFLGKSFAGEGKVEKIIDNFASSPGSGHFSELGMKKSQMQDQASKILATINTILRSVLNLIYDLKEFKIRLSHYDAARSSNKEKKEAGILTLKQIWLDKVDIQRGQGSINALASGNLQFVTVRDAFFVAKSVEAVEDIDLNERVKRLLKPRVLEFFEWKKRSEQELRKRFEIEKSYLKSQVDSLKLQARWAKPYLRAAKRLEQEEDLEKNAALVTAFNTVMMQVTFMGINKAGVGGATYSRMGGRTMPEDFKKLKGKIRDYYGVVVVDFNFIGIPSKSGQHYVFGGKATIDFKSYGLSEDELKLFRYKLDEEDLEGALTLVEGMTRDSLESLQLDIDEFLVNDEKKSKSVDTNPFTALFSGFKRESKPTLTKEEEDQKRISKLKSMLKKGLKKDSYSEAYVRNFAIESAMDAGFKVYDNLKKSMGMAAVPYGGEKGEAGRIGRAPSSTAENLFNLG
jgi:hypothetical protein